MGFSCGVGISVGVEVGVGVPVGLGDWDELGLRLDCSLFRVSVSVGMWLIEHLSLTKP